MTLKQIKEGLAAEPVDVAPGGPDGGNDNVPEIGAVLPPGCPAQPLGHNAGRFYFIDVARQVREMTQSAFSVNGIMDIFGGAMKWAEEYFENASNSRSDKTSWNNVQLTRALMYASYAAGFFDPEKDLRGPGVWSPSLAGRPLENLERDLAGGLIVHAGDRLYCFSPAGKFIGRRDSGARIGGHVYAATRPEQPPADKAAGENQAADMLEFLRTFTWTYPFEDPELWLGHTALSFVAGALRYRPTAWAIGGKGSGKSGLLDIAKAAAGDGMHKYDKATEPGVRHEIKKIWAARGVALDEIEAEENNKSAQQLIELARRAYDREARSVIGGPDGGVTKINAIFYFASIEPPPIKDQDASRTVVYELGPLFVEAEAVEAFDANIDKIHAAGPGLRRRFFESWPRFLAIQAQVRREIVYRRFEPRVANTFAPIVAAQAVMLSGDGELSAAALDKWISHLRRRLAREAGLSSAEECLLHLLTRAGPGVWRGGERKYVGQEIAKAFGRDVGDVPPPVADEDLIDPGDAPPAAEPDEWRPDKTALEMIGDWGLTVVDRSDLRWLAVANSHAGLEEIFAGTRWAGKGWRRVLRQLDNVRVAPGPLYFGPIHSRATLIPEDIVFAKIEKEDDT